MNKQLIPTEQQPSGPRPTGLPVGTTEADFAGIDENTVSPEEQEQYDQFAAKALRIIHSPDSQKEILEQMNQGDMEVHQAVGRSAALMAHAIAGMAESAGVKLSPDAAFHATADYIVPDLYEIGVAAGIFPPDDEQRQLDMAFLEAQRVYGEIILNGPDADKLSEEAQDFYAQQVAREVDEGVVDPESVRGPLGIQKGDPLMDAVAQEMRNMGGQRGA